MEKSWTGAGFVSPTGGGGVLFTTQLAARGPHSWGPWGQWKGYQQLQPCILQLWIQIGRDSVWSNASALFPYVFVRYKPCLPFTSGFQRKDASMSQPGPRVPEPQGGRGQGGPLEENVDILLRRRRVERQHSLTVDGQ